LIVRPSAASLPPANFSSANPYDNSSSASQDIKPLKARFGTLAQIQPPLIQKPWFLMLQGIPALAWLSLLAKRRNEERLAANPRLRRHRLTERIIRDGLKKLRAAANANKPEEFFATVFRLLQEQLGERLDVPASAITEAVIEERLRPANAPEDLIALLRELFQTCNQARYARQSTNEELISLIPKVESALNELKKLKA
jgi:hypothetical protein